jgi:hypothetical protein
MRTAWGLPEFDSLSYGSEMLLTALSKLPVRDVRRAVVFNPGQGHVPVALWQLVRPGVIELADRDLLALRLFPPEPHRERVPAGKDKHFTPGGAGREKQEKADIIAGVLRDEGREANAATLRQAVQRLAPGGLIIIAGGATALTRLAAITEGEKLRIKAREHRRG